MSLDQIAVTIGGLALLALAAVVAVTVLRRSRRHRLPIVPTPVLTKAEIAFYRRLVRIVSRMQGVDIFPQVAMGAILDAERTMDQNARRALRNRFDRKIIDFVLVDDETNVLLIVELDDSTHDSQKDRARDEITRAAGYTTMRIRGKAARDDGEIERMLRSHLS